MKSVLEETEFPAYLNWQDNDYLRSNFGSEKMKVENQKKENRLKEPVKLSIDEFLDIYRKKPVYLIDSITQKMNDDMMLPLTLQCGGFERSIHDVVLWFSSGGTSSVLHRDPLNNLLCIFDGSKDFLLIDKKYKSVVESVGFVENGEYSNIDVDNVDKKKYKDLLSLPWVKAHAEKGDCIFIPQGWYHQIRSNGRRNMAVNYWISHRWWFDHPSCRLFEKFNKTEPLNKYSYASPNEFVRYKMLEAYKDLDVITKNNFLEPNVDKTKRLQLFDFINLDRDTYLTWEELYHFDIDTAVTKFSDVLAQDYRRPEELVNAEIKTKTEADEGSKEDIKSNESKVKKDEL
ncbi:hypothetical protein SNE40_012501 [Patella caerulea]|uniref:JmjC domain-containing protein n=2 Tax=Patella caerulea TaxID=87958 RepID=A0AAN8JNZ7_PATCE